MTCLLASEVKLCMNICMNICMNSCVQLQLLSVFQLHMQSRILSPFFNHGKTFLILVLLSLFLYRALIPLQNCDFKCSLLPVVVFVDTETISSKALLIMYIVMSAEGLSSQIGTSQNNTKSIQVCILLISWKPSIRQTLVIKVFSSL